LPPSEHSIQHCDWLVGPGRKWSKRPNRRAIPLQRKPFPIGATSRTGHYCRGPSRARSSQTQRRWHGRFGGWWLTVKFSRPTAAGLPHRLEPCAYMATPLAPRP